MTELEHQLNSPKPENTNLNRSYNDQEIKVETQGSGEEACVCNTSYCNTISSLNQIVGNATGQEDSDTMDQPDW